jgi:hypothetical protein
MSGLVLELQQAALDSAVSVAEVLRRALMVSKKLRVTTMERWISSELNGYGSDNVPEYRELRLRLMVFNPFHGFQPWSIPNKELVDMLSQCSVAQPLPQLERLLADTEVTLQIPFSSDQQAMLMARMDVPMTPTRVASSTHVQGILDAVRNQVLDWALELEAQGILGDGLSFSSQEREAAQRVTHITNHIGQMHHSQLQVDSPYASQQQHNHGPVPGLAEVIEALARASTKGLTSEDAAELRADVATLKAQSESPKPKTTMVLEGLKSVRNILERAAGSVISAEVLPMVVALLHRVGS